MKEQSKKQEEKEQSPKAEKVEQAPKKSKYVLFYMRENRLRGLFKSIVHKSEVPGREDREDHVSFTFMPGLDAYERSKVDEFRETPGFEKYLRKGIIEEIGSIEEFLGMRVSKKTPYIVDDKSYGGPGRPGCQNLDLVEALMKHEKDVSTLEDLQEQKEYLEKAGFKSHPADYDQDVSKKK